MLSTLATQELLDRYNRPGPRYTSYPTVPVWSAQTTAADYRQALRDLAAHPDDVLSVYVHLPFCESRCHYCGCNATVTRRPEVVDAYLDRLEREITTVTDLMGARRQTVQVHWGGGTPNFLTADQTRRLFGLLNDRFNLDFDGELSIEVDPRIGSREQLELFRSLGFNRISLGVQDIDVVVQQAIGRIQPVELTLGLFEASRELGFSSVNLDVVYGLPSQTPDTFARTLEAILALGPDRVACFSYAHVPWVKPNQKRVDTTLMPDPYTKFQLFQMAIDMFTNAGYEWIGMDHFAKRDDELSVALRERRLHRNFMGYTTRPAPHMLAFGMSSISELAGYYIQNDAKLGDYQKAIDAGDLPVVRGHRMSDDDRMRRAAINHLMCNLELPYDMPARDFGAAGAAFVVDAAERLRPYAEEGFVAYEADRLVVTDLGRLFIRNLCMELDAYLDKNSDRPLFSKTI